MYPEDLIYVKARNMNRQTSHDGILIHLRLMKAGSHNVDSPTIHSDSLFIIYQVVGTNTHISRGKRNFTQFCRISSTILNT